MAGWLLVLLLTGAVGPPRDCWIRDYYACVPEEQQPPMEIEDQLERVWLPVVHGDADNPER